MNKLAICSCLTALLLAGCATDIGPAARKAGVNTIKIEPRIRIYEPLRRGFRTDTGNLTVAITDVVVNEIYAKQLARLAAEMQTNAIIVPRMVHERVSQVLREDKGFGVVTNGGDAAFAITIDQFGFEDTGLVKSKHVPFIVLRAELKTGEKRVWRGEGGIHPWRSGEVGAPLEDYYVQPELLRQHWETQVERAVRKLLAADPANH